MSYALLSKNVASLIYVLLLDKFAKVPGLGDGGVNPILAMPGFCVHMDPQPTPNAAFPLKTFFNAPPLSRTNLHTNNDYSHIS